jgi:hypothetical protein
MYFLRGWLESVLAGAERCQDEEVAHHYRRERVLEVARAVLGRGIRFVR